MCMLTKKKQNEKRTTLTHSVWLSAKKWVIKHNRPPQSYVLCTHTLQRFIYMFHFIKKRHTLTSSLSFFVSLWFWLGGGRILRKYLARWDKMFMIQISSASGNEQWHVDKASSKCDRFLIYLCNRRPKSNHRTDKKKMHTEPHSHTIRPEKRQRTS